MTVAAPPPDLRRRPLVARASRSLARSPWSTTPPIRFVCLGPQLRSPLPSAPASRLDALRFTRVPATRSPEDSHLQVIAHAGRTNQKAAALRCGFDCPSWARTRTLLIQSQACCQLHQGALTTSSTFHDATSQEAPSPAPPPRATRRHGVVQRCNGAEGARTPDLLGAIQALSQLSYSPAGLQSRYWLPTGQPFQI